jgi:hypothetical protein
MHAKSPVQILSALDVTAAISHHRPTELLISIGGVVGHLLVSGPAATLVADLRQRYAAFCLPCSPKVERHFTLRIVLQGRPAAIDPERSAEPPRLQTQADRIEIERLDFHAALERQAGRGSFAGSATCQANPVAFESLLRVLWSVFLPRHGGALFHACGFRTDGRGILAPGPSGAGKTTLARKVPANDVLSDEVVAVHRDQGQWRISATPFFGELQRNAGSLQSWPLAGIAFLEKRSVLGSAPLPAAVAVLRTLECLLCFASDPETVQQNFALVIALCGDVPAFVCASRADTPLADILHEIGPRLGAGARKEPRPRNPRELVSALRAELVRHGSYAFAPTGTSMRPWLRTGDALFIEALDHDTVAPGDLILYWRAGRSPERDALICHRVIGQVPGRRGTRIYTKGDAIDEIETFENGKEAQIIGRVRSIARAGEHWPVPGPMGNVALLLSSLLVMPFLKLLARR